MPDMREMEMETLNDVDAAKAAAMEQAQIADSKEEDMYTMEPGEYSTDELNKLVDSLNRVNKLFKAPMYPSFDKFPEDGTLPPEFIRNLDMVNQALNDAGIEDKMFDLSMMVDDKEVKMVAGKLDAAAGDRAFKAYLNKPLGMGELQAEMGVPTTQPEGGDVMRESSGPATSPGGMDELFMARLS